MEFGVHHPFDGTGEYQFGLGIEWRTETGEEVAWALVAILGPFEFWLWRPL